MKYSIKKVLFNLFDMYSDFMNEHYTIDIERLVILILLSAGHQEQVDIIITSRSDICYYTVRTVLKMYVKINNPE